MFQLIFFSQTTILKREILPRGIGIVNRCPVIISTQSSHAGADEVITFASDQYADTKSFTGLQNDWTPVTEEIQRRTIARAQRGQNISREEIKLTISSPNVPDLVIVDLPGFTAGPVG